MLSSNITLDAQREIFTLSLTRADHDCVLAVLQWMIGHFSDRYIDTAMLVATRDRFRDLNRCMIEADSGQEPVVLVLESRQARVLREVLGYAVDMLVDEPLLPEPVRAHILAVEAALRPSLRAAFDTLHGRFPGLG